jgi:hypothetical protein
MPGPLGPVARYEQNIIDRIANFHDPRQEWRRDHPSGGDPCPLRHAA